MKKKQELEQEIQALDSKIGGEIQALDSKVGGEIQADLTSLFF